MTMQVNPQIDITHQCLTKLSNYCENTYSSSIDTHGVQNGANLEEKANNFCWIPIGKKHSIRLK